ncbi:GCC2 and GCC3, partial [Oesophagostomum dentatum]
ACSIECREGYEFSRSPAIFYTCAADGVWRPRNRNQMVFRYPQCTNDQTGCVGARVDVDCSEDFMRVKRSSHMFNVRVELPVKRDLVSHSVSGQKSKVSDALQDEIINQGAFNLEKVLPSGRPDLSTFQLLDEFHCQVGQVTVGDMCVPCAPGSYHSLTTSQCELCSEGEYQPLAGRTECFKCPEGQITAGEGAINENECKESCPAGNYFDLALSKCAPCGYGFFQPRPGAFECAACDVGKTTMSETAVSEEECRDECPDGEHLSSSGSCQPCPAGSYRTRGEHKQCVQCPD